MSPAVFSQLCSPSAPKEPGDKQMNHTCSKIPSDPKMCERDREREGGREEGRKRPWPAVLTFSFVFSRSNTSLSHRIFRIYAHVTPPKHLKRRRSGRVGLTGEKKRGRPKKESDKSSYVLHIQMWLLKMQAQKPGLYTLSTFLVLAWPEEFAPSQL